MEIKKRLLSISEMTRPGEKIKSINKVIVHSLKNQNMTAIENRNYFESLKNQTEIYNSVHYIIGLEGEIINIIPEDEVSYNTNNMDFNYETISVAYCNDDITEKPNSKTERSYISLLRYLCAKYNLNPKKDILRHYDISGTRCPMYYVDNVSEFLSLKERVKM